MFVLAYVLHTRLVQAQDATLAAKIREYLRPFFEGNNFMRTVLIAPGDRTLVSQAYGLGNHSLHVVNTPSTRFPIEGGSPEHQCEQIDK